MNENVTIFRKSVIIMNKSVILNIILMYDPTHPVLPMKIIFVRWSHKRFTIIIIIEHVEFLRIHKSDYIVISYVYYKVHIWW